MSGEDGVNVGIGVGWIELVISSEKEIKVA
jgi:hypothetical protein